MGQGSRYTKTLYQAGYCKALEIISQKLVKGEFLFWNVQGLTPQACSINPLLHTRDGPLSPKSLEVQLYKKVHVKEHSQYHILLL